MAAKTTHTSGTANDNPMPHLNLFEASFGNPFLIVARLQAKTLRKALEWQVETMDFYKHRFERDISFIDELMKATEPRETLSTCSNFFQGALDDYSQEAAKAASFSSRVAIDTADDIRHEAETLSEDMEEAAA